MCWLNRRLRGGLLLIGLLGSTIGWGQTVRSVLQTGQWLKIGVTETGIVRLDYATLTKANPAFATADPRLFRLYGNGGAALPQPNATARPVDLLENAVQVTGESDGRFDPADALLFFGQGSTKITVDAAGKPVSHQLNPYADTTFYFLTIGPSAAVPRLGMRVANRAAGNTITGTPITTYTDYVFHEAERVKPLASGRYWLGEAFQGELSQRLTVTLNTPGRIANTSVLVRSAVMASSTAQTTYFLQVNGSDIGSQTVEPVADALTRYTTRGMLNTSTFTTTPTGAGEGLSIQLTSSRKGGAGSSGYLDFLSAQYQRELRQYDQPTLVRSTAGRFVAKQATAALRIWDVTNPLRPAQQAYSLTGLAATWSSDSLARHEYMLFTDATTGLPASINVIANQDIRGQQAPNLLIVTPLAWRAEADRLAQYRRTNDSLSVLVVTTQQVYNEFSSGQPDPTAIRDMCRYFYQYGQSGSPSAGLRYLLLFGDATYDYRNIDQFLSPTEQASMVPVYESRESLHPLLSFSSDDYFGFLKDTDGEWTEDFTGDQRLDIGVGRLPVKSLDEAKTVVDKLIRYATDKTTGNWRSQLLIVADDGDDNIHQRDADQLATYVETHAPAYHPDRLFIDLFPRTADTVGTQVVPKSLPVNARIRQAMQDGRLIINYTGHGGIREWAQEQILTLKDILTTPVPRLPLFVTATCEFGRYDDPTSSSGAEIALLNPTGGGIGLLTTTRPVFADKNLLLNQAFYRTVFQPRAGRMPRLGDVIRATKDSSLAGVQNRNFTLLGDPSMRLAYPRAEVVLTGLNGHALTVPDTLRALQQVTLTGEVRLPGMAQALANFSGTAQLTLYDKPTSLTTLGLEGNPKMAFRSYTNRLYSGQVRVQNGQFQAQFTLPKDLDLTVGPGRLYAYALRDDGLTDAGGATDLPLGGVARTPPVADVQPPVIRLSLADTLATVPYLTVAGPTVTLLVDLSDNEGINLSQAVKDHALTLQLDGRDPVLLSTYYTATTADGRQGRVRYSITGLTNGTYTAHVRAYDLSNNAADATLTFVVTDKPPLSLRPMTAFPNPFSDKTTITATHNRPGDNLDWSLVVFDATGKLLSEQQGQCPGCPSPLVISGWDGRESSGLSLVNGLYIYKLQVHSVSDGSTATGSGTLLLMR
ncbi:type IX secretion system sortase PorU [Fibrella sp. HMF5335]|uniref:Type IX secretion system sortase PorU n=1 Tax=Fibrella rubiginis TaxID=2817060 RepID=A0A939GHZ3_9BACT|nr:type IX secretion system sortase PorU [Fibrella rubiginis]MBO0938656.1 type IX secretion system sortase PorU [Fibrella rubiginis]